MSSKLATLVSVRRKRLVDTGQLERDLVTALRAIQRAEGMTDREMALRLGVTRAHWNHICLGVRHLGVQTLRGVARGFKDLRPLTVALITDDSTQVAVAPPTGARRVPATQKEDA